MSSIGTRWSTFKGRVTDNTRQIQIYAGSIALSVAFGCAGASLQRLSAQAQKASGTLYSSKRVADGKHVDDTQSGCQHCAVLLLRRCGTELPSVGPFVHLGVGPASMSIIGRWMAIADRRRMAADGEAPRWRRRGFG
jgi:hypothetical protein